MKALHFRSNEGMGTDYMVTGLNNKEIKEIKEELEGLLYIGHILQPNGIKIDFTSNKIVNVYIRKNYVNENEESIKLEKLPKARFQLYFGPFYYAPKEVII